MAIFGLRNGRPVPDRERRFATGKLVCDVMAKGKTLGTSEHLSSFEDVELRQEFMSFAGGSRISIDDIATMTDEAASVGAILDRINAGSEVGVEDLDRSMKFFKNLYRSL
jgi:hypothetical protein